MIFKVLHPDDKAAFQEYARANDPPDMKSWSVYHPVCRAIWQTRGIGLDMPPTDDEFVFEREENN